MSDSEYSSVDMLDEFNVNKMQSLEISDSGQYVNNTCNLKQSVFPCWEECQDLSVHDVKNLVGNSPEHFMSQNSQHGSKVYLESEKGVVSTKSTCESA